MDKTSVFNKVSEIIKEVLELEDEVITENTTAEDIEDWDSIMHVEIIVDIENQLNIKFKTLEIEKFKSVGDIVNCVISKKS